MKKEKFSESLNNINDKYIDEAVKYSAENQPNNANEGGIGFTKPGHHDEIKAELKKNSPGSRGYDSKDNTTKKPKQESGNRNGDTSDKLTKTIKFWRGIAIAACAVIVCGLGISLISNVLTASRISAAYEAIDSFEYDPEIEAAPDYDYLYEAANSYEYGIVDGDEVYIEETTTAGAPASGGTSDYVDTGSEADVSDADVVTDPTKMIYTVNVWMETDDFDGTVSDIDKCVSDAGGYYQNMSVDNSGYSYRDAYYTIRIPAENLDSFLANINGVGTVTSISKNADDVSSYYYDIESRLTTAETKLARLQELLAEASDMTDIITIENEISDTEQEIDDLTGTLKGLDSEVSYSTVYLELSEVYNTEYTEPEPLTFGQRLSNAFNGGLSTFGNFIKGTVLWLASSWIWLLIIAAIVVAVVLIVKKISKKNKDK